MLSRLLFISNYCQVQSSTYLHAVRLSSNEKEFIKIPLSCTRRYKFPFLAKFSNQWASRHRVRVFPIQPRNLLSHKTVTLTTSEFDNNATTEPFYRNFMLMIPIYCLRENISNKTDGGRQVWLIYEIFKLRINENITPTMGRVFLKIFIEGFIS